MWVVLCSFTMLWKSQSNLHFNRKPSALSFPVEYKENITTLIYEFTVAHTMQEESPG